MKPRFRDDVREVAIAAVVILGVGAIVAMAVGRPECRPGADTVYVSARFPVTGCSPK